MSYAPPLLPYLDSNLSIEDRLSDLLKRLTYPEKIDLLHAKSPKNTRLNLPEYHMGNEALHGVVSPGKATVFPQAITFGATWDPDLIKKVGEVIADEGRAKQNTVPNANSLLFWCPTINMARHPLWGRNPETYGEDPWLTSRIAIGFIRGMQGDHPRYLKVAATPKHYAGNNQDSIRHKCWANIDMRTFREYLLPHFHAAITEAKAQGIMAAYNAVFGLPCCANPFILTQILREEWKFPGFDGNGGFIVTDCSAYNDFLWPRYHITNTRKQAVALGYNAGIDIECGSYVEDGNLLNAYRSGLVSDAVIDRVARNVLRTQFLLGIYDPAEMNPYTKIPASVVGCEANLQLAQTVAEKGIVLLKNNPLSTEIKNVPLLPLRPELVKSIAIVGPNAVVAQLGDYTGIPTTPAISPLEAIQKKYVTSKIQQVPWLVGNKKPKYELIPTVNLIPSIDCKKYRGLKRVFYTKSHFNDPTKPVVDEKIVFFWGKRVIDQAVSNAATDADGGIRATDQFSIRWNGFIKPDFAGKYEIKLVFVPSKVHKKAKATLKIANTVQSSGISVLIELDPTQSYPIEVELPDGREGDNIRLEWKTPQIPFDESFSREVTAAKQNDYVIAIIGSNVYQERENMDRTSMKLPEEQIKMLNAVINANPKVIVLIIAGSPLSIEWIHKNIPAVVMAWIPGQRGGNAIANIISGDVNPSGKLPFAFYYKDSDVPSIYEYDITKGLTYWYNPIPPLYSFGFGLSYTTFDYRNFKISATNFSIEKNESFTISGVVFNIGSYNGEEIIQVYICKILQPNDSNLKIYPQKQLKGFKKVLIPKGESIPIAINISISQIQFFNSAINQLACEIGSYEVMVGKSSSEILFRFVIELFK